MRRHDPFGGFDDWQDTDGIKSEVERAFARGADVSVAKLRRALRRVVYDGHHGPISDRDWADVDGERMPMVRAVEILRRAMDADLPTVELTHPDHGYTCDGADSCKHRDHEELDEEGPLFHEEPVEIDRHDLLRWYFGELIPIYGSLNV